MDISLEMMEASKLTGFGKQKKVSFQNIKKLNRFLFRTIKET